MKFFAIFLVVIPVVEIMTLIALGKQIGFFNTIVLLILMGILGAYLLKHQGANVMKKASEQMRNGELPGPAILDGICILVGSIMLILPGFISDVIAFVFLLPLTRKFVKPVVIYCLTKLIAKGKFVVRY